MKTEGATGYEVSLFEKKDSNWALSQTLLPEEGVGRFGYSLDIDHDTAVVSALGAKGAGSVFVYRRDGDAGKWRLEQRIEAEPGEDYQKYWFGAAVSISGDTMLVGQVQRRVPDCERSQVFVYVREGKRWRLQQKLAHPGGKPHLDFGYSVDVEGDLAVVGAREVKDESSARKVGTACIFRRTGDKWALEQEIAEEETFRFGQSVAVGGDRVVVGTLGRGENAFVFRNTGEEGWVRESILRKPLPSNSDQNFGYSLDFDGSTIAIAAPNLSYTCAFTLNEDGTSWSGGSAVFSESMRGGEEQFVAVDGATILALSYEKSEAPEKRRQPIVSVITQQAKRWRNREQLEFPITPTE